MSGRELITVTKEAHTNREEKKHVMSFGDFVFELVKMNEQSQWYVRVWLGKQYRIYTLTVFRTLIQQAKDYTSQV